MRKRRTVGQLRPECAYNADGLMRYFGIGEKTLKQARRAGVKPVQVGTQLVYSGADLIGWMFSQGRVSGGEAQHDEEAVQAAGGE